MDAPINVIDGIVIIFTVLSAILATARGFTREVLGILSVLGAVLIAVHGAHAAAPIFASIINLQSMAAKLSTEPSIIAGFIAGCILFVLAWVILTILTRYISETVNNSVIGNVDSGLGFIYGTVRGLFILSMVYVLYAHFIPRDKYHQTVAHAKTLPLLDIGAGAILTLGDAIFPGNISENFAKQPDDDSTLEQPNDITGAINAPTGRIQTPEDVISGLKTLQQP